MSDFIKIRPLGVELFYADKHMDGQTDMTKLVAVYCNFANAPINELINRVDMKFKVTRPHAPFPLLGLIDDCITGAQNFGCKKACSSSRNKIPDPSCSRE